MTTPGATICKDPTCRRRSHEHRCSVKGCDNKRRSWGLCHKHAMRYYRTGKVESSHRKECSVEGCTRKHRGFGYCTMHYHRYRKYGDPLFRLRPERGPYCEIPGCRKPHHSYGLCNHHRSLRRSLRRSEFEEIQNLRVDKYPTALLKELIKQSGLCAAHVCRGAGVEPRLLYNKTVSLFTADAICTALGVHVDHYGKEWVA